MKNAKETFIKHYEKASGKKCDEVVLSHMQYAIDAMNEHATNHVKECQKAITNKAVGYSHTPVMGGMPRHNRVKVDHYSVTNAYSLTLIK